MLRIKLLVFWILLSITNITYAEKKVIDVINTPQAQLTNLLNNITSMYAHFFQTVSNKLGAILQEQTGIMQLKRPNLLHWQVLTPDRLLIITDGNKLWYYDQDLEQVTIKNFSTEINNAKISGLLLGDLTKTLSHYEVKFLSPPACNFEICFELNNKESQEEISFIKAHLGFNKKHQLVMLKLYDQLEQETEFIFSKIKNVIRSDLFKFTVPPGIDVIEE